MSMTIFTQPDGRRLGLRNIDICRVYSTDDPHVCHIDYRRWAEKGAGDEHTITVLGMFDAFIATADKRMAIFTQPDGTLLGMSLHYIRHVYSTDDPHSCHVVYFTRGNGRWEENKITVAGAFDAVMAVTDGPE